MICGLIPFAGCGVVSLRVGGASARMPLGSTRRWTAMPGAHAQYIGCAQDRRDIDMRACSASPGALPFSALAQRVAWGRAYGAPYMATTLGYTLGSRSVWSVGCHESVCGVCDTTRSDLHFLYPRDRDRSLARFQLHHLRRRTGTHIRAPRARALALRRSDSPRRESRAPGPARAVLTQPSATPQGAGP